MSKKQEIRILELFSGTHSIGKVAEKRGWIVYSLDRDLPQYDKLDKEKKYKSHIHHQEDIMTWDYMQYPVGFFHIVTASPVCLWWSRLRNCWIGRRLKGMTEDFTKQHIINDINTFGKPMVDKVREIINYFNPKYYWIENPKSSKMKNYITDLPSYEVDYCKYSPCDNTWGYKKSTRFWTNIKDFTPKICKKDCLHIVTIKTQKGDCHSGYKTLIKGKTRTLHTTNIGDSKKKKALKNAVIIKKQHSKVLGNGYESDGNGNKILCNTKALRDKYRKSKTHSKSVSKDYGSGSNRLMRYRIPPLLINDLFDCMKFN